MRLWLWVVIGMLALGSIGASAQAPDLRLIDAVKLQDAVAVSRLLDASVDVNAAHADGATALHWAAYLDDIETARLLVDAGADAGAVNTHGVVPAVARLHQRQLGDGGSAASGGRGCEGRGRYWRDGADELRAHR